MKGCHLSFTLTQSSFTPQSLHLAIFFSLLLRALLLDSIGSAHGTPQPRMNGVREEAACP